MKCTPLPMIQGARAIFLERVGSRMQPRKAGCSMTRYGYVIIYIPLQKSKLSLNQNNVLFGEAYDEERYQKSTKHFHLAPNNTDRVNFSAYSMCS